MPHLLILGVLLSPEIIRFIPSSFVADTSLATDLALAFITFEVGGTLHWPKLKRLGRSILWITLLEAELAFVAVRSASSSWGGGEAACRAGSIQRGFCHSRS